MSRIMYLKEAAAYLGKAPFTLQSWDRAGKLKLIEQLTTDDFTINQSLISI